MEDGCSYSGAEFSMTEQRVLIQFTVGTTSVAYLLHILYVLFMLVILRVACLPTARHFLILIILPFAYLDLFYFTQLVSN